MRLKKNIFSVLSIVVLQVAWGIFSKTVFAQELIPTTSTQVETPTITTNLTPMVKKKPGPNPRLRQNKFPVSQQDANVEAVKKTEELRKEGKLKTFGTPGTFRRVQKPTAPTNFQIKPSYGMANLSWDPVPGDDMAYLIYISENGKNYQRRILAPIRKTRIIIGNLTNGKKYYFAVSAFGSKESDRSIQTVVPVANKPSSK